jgi:chromosomal replication initiation ATPase DnaA
MLESMTTLLRGGGCLFPSDVSNIIHSEVDGQEFCHIFDCFLEEAVQALRASRELSKSIHVLDRLFDQQL